MTEDKLRTLKVIQNHTGWLWNTSRCWYE